MSKSNQRPGQGLTIAAFLTAVLLLAGGLIFLCAAVQDAARFPIALALLLVGGALATWSGLRLRRARQLAPDTLDDRITQLADTFDGELTLAQVISTLDVPDDAARAALARLEASGLSHQERRDNRSMYIFPGLKESNIIRRCTYCGNEYSVREPLHKCPNCGGSLELVKT